MNPNSSEFVPGRFFGAPVAAPAPQPQPAPAPVAAEPIAPKKESWEDEEKPAEAAPVEQKAAPVASSSSSSSAPAQPTTSKFVIEDDDMEEDGPEDGEPTVGDVEKKLKKLDWGSNDSVDPREHLNIVFIGHVDAGKSTCSGQLLYLTGMVDERTIERFQKDATSANRGSWFLAYIMDTIEEERAKGKTVEVGRAHFETEKKRYTILDAPGHKNYVPNMIMGVAQADVGILIISARKGEFEAGFDRNGQTREHAILARTLGVRSIMIAINKMDDESVQWSQERYDLIKTKMTQFLKGLGYDAKEIYCLPISGLAGHNMKEKLDSKLAPWYSGDSLIGTLDSMPPIPRAKDAPLRIPILDKFKEMGGLNVMGKVESGVIRVGQKLVLQPGTIKVEVVSLANDMADLTVAEPGENIRVVLKGVDEEHVHRGFVLCDAAKPIPSTNEFVAQFRIMELPENKSLFTAGYQAVVHIHTAVEECTVVRLLAEIDGKTGEISKKLPNFVRSKSIVNAHVQLAQAVPCELFKDFQQLGRFTLRDEGKTVAFGKVLHIGPPKRKSDKK